jgi:NADPH:quinone reductase-like Zn-dependent oxidoreductase
MREFYLVEKTGSLRNLKPHRSEIPALEKGKVLVGVRSVGLNYADIFAIMGLYSATPQVPFIPGLEFSGEVLSSDSGKFQVGQKVMGVTRFGGYDSHIVADPEYLFPLPAGWSYEEGAAEVRANGPYSQRSRRRWVAGPPYCEKVQRLYDWRGGRSEQGGAVEARGI